VRGRWGVFVVAGLSFLTLAGLVSVGIGLFDRLSLSAKVETSAFECLEKGKWRSCVLPPTPYMLITSDIHLSSPSGRWPETTQNFRSFVEEVSKNPPEVIFVAGDVVDNAAENYPGSLSNWREEWEIYSSIREAYKGIQFRQSYGTGHDWLNGEMLAILDKDVGDRKGVFSWRGLNFVWLSFGPGAFFPNAPEHKPDLEDEDYHWLAKTLASVSNASLIFHVPLSTPLSTELGVFSGGRLIVLDPRDHLYKIIDTYRNKIDTIFSGHIHRAYRDEHNGIPIFSCPFMGKKNFCIVQVADKKPEVRQYRFVELQ
jgi:3',5'-cyclic AMP phosphodiesterase CpdA